MPFSKFNGWGVLGVSVIGASHVRKGTDNQDAIALYQGGDFSNGVKPAMVAVSDGHGSAKYIRSKMGSKLATKCAIELAKKMHQSDSYLSSKASKGNIEDAVRHVKTMFMAEWHKAIDKNYATNPFTDGEQSFLEENCSEKDFDSVMSNHRVAYGCTFLCAFAYADLILVLQHGDGDVLGLYADGEVKEIIEPDPRNVGNETMSLCKMGSPLEIQHKIVVGDDLPVMLMLSTDGVSNSFADKIGFYKILLGLKDLLVKSDFSIGSVDSTLQSELERITEDGSGDDVTVGVLFSRNKIKGK